MFRSVMMSLAVAGIAGAASAADAPPAMRAFVESDVLGWALTPEVVNAIKAQNARTGSASQADIDAWDQAWRGQVGHAAQPLIDEVLNTPASHILAEHVASSGGRITEIFIMDAKGLNVASSAITSDYWQGDEAKFTKSYGAGAGAIFVDEVALDESTQTYQGQVSVAISDPATGEVIGAMTIGLNAEAFY